jgi:hypothetical protein
VQAEVTGRRGVRRGHSNLPLVYTRDERLFTHCTLSSYRWNGTIQFEGRKADRASSRLADEDSKDVSVHAHPAKTRESDGMERTLRQAEVGFVSIGVPVHCFALLLTETHLFFLFISFTFFVRCELTIKCHQTYLYFAVL